jgi:hypothetical protein
MTITDFFDSALTSRCTSHARITDVDDFHDPELVWPQAANTWTMTAPFTTISGLDHLEGETVSILADGNVVTPQAVLNGSVTLATACN